MNKKNIFMFSGQGSQYYQMAKKLFDQDLQYRQIMLDLDKIVIEMIDISIVHTIYNNEFRNSQQFTRTLLSHPAIFMVEYALAQVLITRGIRPDYVLGSSLGEFAAATIAGVLDASTALRCVIQQAKCFEQYCATGSMLTVLSPISIYDQLPDIEYCTLVSVSYDGHFVISGSVDRLVIIQKYLAQQSIACQLLPVSFAFHSPAIDPAEQPYLEFLRTISFQKPTIPYLSCLQGGLVTAIQPDHFWQVARQPILFQQTIQYIESSAPHMYIDNSPGGTLSTLVKRNLNTHSLSSTTVILGPALDENVNIERLFNQSNRVHHSTPYSSVPSQSQGGEQLMRAYVFPGQGSQYKGMGKEYFAEFPELIAQANEILGYSMEELCLKDTQNQIGHTSFTQPALYVVNALMYYTMIKENKTPDYVAGHSLGEFNALLAAGVFDFATGLKIVQYRGALMGEANGGAMAAVVGLDQASIERILKENRLSTIDIANLNTPSQIVISGPKDDLVQAQSIFEQQGATNYVMLKVSAAFHSRYMANVQQKFADYLKQFHFNMPAIPVISNVYARPYESNNLYECMIQQITSSVQWTDSIRYLMGKGVQEIIQVGPGKAVTNMVAAIQREASPLIIEESIVEPPQQEVPTSTAHRYDASTLGCHEFKKEYNLKLAYIAGGMYGGIASVRMVSTLASFGCLAFLGTGGLTMERIEADIVAVQQTLRHGESYGVNFLHNQVQPDMEQQLVELLLKHQVNIIEAKGFLTMTTALVYYRVSGVSLNSNGEIKTSHRIIAKCSRPEIATLFMSPPPQHILDQLVQSRHITAEQANWAKKIPMADDICAEADSGGYTDSAVMMALLPSLLSLRTTIMKQYSYPRKIRVGAAGGIGTPEAAAAVFVMGADFILTGSINQCTVEAGTSTTVKELLQHINVQDTEYAPAGDMFELGAKVQVLKKGLYFPARANKLYELYRQYNAIEDIDEKTKARLQEQYFKKSFADIYDDVKKTHSTQEIERAERSPKAKMALLFKWYFTYSTELALHGDQESKVDYQVYCGPALGAFNQWVQGTLLEHWQQRHVDQIADKLMNETADLLNHRLLHNQ
ncbi:Polyketide biosynthesis acyltransferase like protein BaeD [Paenibacillus nuruki]|uniref:[acyl-carrier-protein] S-malonyltransferase n=1 Tax=Paenibacillus nuruki TaxID=1886670 RepID=A0A1E3L3P4_9BACL|nr:ACP S-malonyltransferase [Paenibacillus nuruki]ODP28429.1 Polyketide biosynthesis acyltransferase like protein BaeD [Paenibacillus nuruki]